MRALRFAAMNCNYIKYPLSYFLHSAAAFGFDAIELFGAMPHFYIDDVDDDFTEKVRNEAESLGLEIVSFCPAQGVYPMNIAVDEARVRERTVRMLKKALHAAWKLKAKTMLVSPGFGYENQDRRISWEYSRASLTELSKTAEETGVVITIEPLTPLTANLVNTSADARKMVEEVASPFVKSMMDIGVMNFMGETVDEYFRNLGPDLRHIHFTDGPGAHVALGDGTFPMDAYLRDIQKNGYQGILSFEINDRRYLKDPDDALRKNTEWLAERNMSPHGPAGPEST